MEEAVRKELDADPTFQSFQQEEFAFQQQLRQLRALKDADQSTNKESIERAISNVKK